MDKNPRDYLQEIRNNVAKFQQAQVVTPRENALFGMIDGLAGVTLALMENVADLKRRVEQLEAAMTVRDSARALRWLTPPRAFRHRSARSVFQRLGSRRSPC